MIFCILSTSASTKSAIPTEHGQVGPVLEISIIAIQLWPFPQWMCSHPGVSCTWFFTTSNSSLLTAWVQNIILLYTVVASRNDSPRALHKRRGYSRGVHNMHGYSQKTMIFCILSTSASTKSAIPTEHGQVGPVLEISIIAIQLWPFPLGDYSHVITVIDPHWPDDCCLPDEAVTLLCPCKYVATVTVTYSACKMIRILFITIYTWHWCIMFCILIEAIWLDSICSRAQIDEPLKHYPLVRWGNNWIRKE